MHLSRYRLPLALLVVLACAQELRLGAQRAADAAFAPFWRADSARNALKAVDQLVASSPDFDSAYQLLKRGRPYRKERTGEFSLRHTAGWPASSSTTSRCPTPTIRRASGRCACSCTAA